MSSGPAWLVGAEARPFLEWPGDESAETAVARMPQRARAVRVLGDESKALPRAMAGVLAWLVALAGVAALTYAAWHGNAPGLRGSALVLGGALVLAAALLGRVVWRAGRSVVDAFCWWTLLPERLPDGGAGVPDWRAEPVRDAVRARIFMLEGGRMVRIGLAVLGFLAPLAFLQQATNGSPRFPETWPGDQTAALLVAFLGSLAVSWPAGAVAFGGQLRANRAYTRRDPVSRAIGRRFGGR